MSKALKIMLGNFTWDCWKKVIKCNQIEKEKTQEMYNIRVSMKKMFFKHPKRKCAKQIEIYYFIFL